MEVNVEYVWGQLMRARQRAAEHGDDARAREAVAKWERVIVGLQAKTIEVGSRTPVAAPVWVTLEVVKGGFATGVYVAGGPLGESERALAERLSVPANRLALNLHYLTSSGLDALLASGCYRVEVPEEAALLVVAWLRQRGDLQRASALVGVLAPWFDALRFYPAPATGRLELTDTVQLQDLETTIRQIDVDRRHPRFETMRASVLQWNPLRARAVGLFAETIDGKDGWPGTIFPAGWHARVARLVADREAGGEPSTRRGREACQLIAQLARCATDPRSIAPPEYEQIRRAIARYIAAYGHPDDPAHELRRSAAAAAVQGPSHRELRQVLVKRLRDVPTDRELDLATALAPVTPIEASRTGVPAGAALPPYLEPKVARGLRGSIEELVARGVIGSGEVLARTLPQVTSQVRAQTIDDAAARSLYVATYTAFRRRRGLLLLDYQHQVRFEELPWVAVLEAAREGSAGAASRAREAAARISGTALRAFPHAIVPNKLVTELAALTNAAALQLPLVQELAADIFMGAFTAKFVEAAKISARLLAGSLYQRYYAIDPDELARLEVPANGPSSALAAICERRAGPVGSKPGWSVARNGKVIEQAQILTAHNLAVLFDALSLRERLAPDVRAIAETCFRWSIRRLRLRTDDAHQVLVNLKNAAYAWRQMLFYLSFGADLPGFVDGARSEVARADEPFRRAFEPAIRGLELAAGGMSSNAPDFVTRGGRVFTGWSTERHWLTPVADR